MAVLLALTGIVVYRIFRSDLNATIDRSLSSRSAAIAALVHQSDDVPALGPVAAVDDFAQVLGPDGTLAASTPNARTRALLTRAELRRAGRGPVLVDRAPVAGLEGPVRVRAVPVRTTNGPRVVAVGTALGQRDDSLRTLGALLAGGGTVALVLASVAGWGVAASALRPVEAMRRRAAGISPARSDERLPVAPSGDEIARLGGTLNEMLDRLQAAFARERQFTADASHELRTPLGILRTELELALRRGRSPDELRAALASAAEETDRLIQLAEDLLVIARLDQGRLPLRAAGLDAGLLAVEVAARFDARARERGGSVRAAPPDGIWMRGDRLRLEQALGSMVDNALRHGGGDVRLAVVARDGVVELHVRDDGPGFAPGFLDRAFERFARGDGDRSRGGSGLGLAIVAAIAASHGGCARAANPSVGGADVWLELPAAAGAAGAPDLR